ncbi:MAG: phosphodiesterase, partial [Acidobacteriota bacterium]|nr:phosphodiesterase [Acidobacteriota bacterium]
PGPEYDAVVQQIKEGLEGLVDEATGLKPVANVWTREEMYGDFDPRLIPDLRVSNTEGYRVSWQTSLGGFGAELIEDNTKAWSGDHCSLEPELVQGILFSNRPLRLDSPTMVDLMPTILEALGVAAPANIDGESML